MTKHTAGPWEWFMHSGERPYLATPDRGRLYVMDFTRKGMQGACPRFSQWDGIDNSAERDRRGGIMCDGIMLKDGRLHPDARLIASAPALLEALQDMTALFRSIALMKGWEWTDYAECNKARAAIASAIGDKT